MATIDPGELAATRNPAGLLAGALVLPATIDTIGDGQNDSVGGILNMGEIDHGVLLSSSGGDKKKSLPPRVVDGKRKATEPGFPPAPKVEA